MKLRPETASNQTPTLKWMLRLLTVMGGYRTKKNILSYATMISNTMLVVLLLMDMVLNWNGMETLKRVKFLPSMCLSDIKSIFIILNASKLINLVKMLKDFWRIETFAKPVQERMSKLQKYITIVCAGYAGACVLLCVAIFVKPFREKESIILVVCDYALCDLTAGWCWWFNYMWQAYAVMFQIAPTSLGYDCIFIIFTGYIYIACHLFTARLERLNTDDHSMRRHFLTLAIRQHDMMMTFVHLVDDMFSVVMLLQFWCSLWSMILFLNMIVADGLPPKIDDAIFYGTMYLAFVFQLTIYSVGGAIIEDQIRNVSDGIFLVVDWFNQGRTDLRKDLSFMIMRAQNARILTAGKMSDLNLILWIATMKNSLSVFTLIWQLSNAT